MEADLQQWGALAAAVVTVANVITAMTPSVTKYPMWNKVLRLLNIISLNVGKNKNADEVAAKDAEQKVA